jgi:hypothetical protein
VSNVNAIQPLPPREVPLQPRKSSHNIIRFFRKTINASPPKQIPDFSLYESLTKCRPPSEKVHYCCIIAYHFSDTSTNDLSMTWLHCAILYLQSSETIIQNKAKLVKIHLGQVRLTKSLRRLPGQKLTRWFSMSFHLICIFV